MLTTTSASTPSNYTENQDTTYIKQRYRNTSKVFRNILPITSSYIVENSFEHNQLYFKLGREEYLLCTGTTEESQPKRKSLDIGCIMLDLPITESLFNMGYKFLPNDKILPNHDPLDTPQYAIVGFPKPTSGQEQEFIQTNGSYIISPMVPDNYYHNHNYTKLITHHVIQSATRNFNWLQNQIKRTFRNEWQLPLVYFLHKKPRNHRIPNITTILLKSSQNSTSIKT